MSETDHLQDTETKKNKKQVPFLKSVSVPGRNQRPGSASSFNSLKRSFSAGLASELCSPAVRRSMWDSGGLAWPEQHWDGDCRKLVGSDAAERTNQTVEKWEEAPGRPEAQDGAVSWAHPTGCGSLLALLLLLYPPFSQREWMNATIRTIFFQAMLIPVCMFLLRELSHSLQKLPITASPHRAVPSQ